MESIPRHVLIAAQFSCQNTPAPAPIVIDLMDDGPDEHTHTHTHTPAALPSITTTLLPHIPLA
ncbi:hypothetical protein EON65_36245, partial [archaeon]